MPIPDPLKKFPWWRSTWFLELAAAIPGVGGVIFLGYRLGADSTTPHWYATLTYALAGWLGVASLIRILNALVEAESRKRKHDLRDIRAQMVALNTEIRTHHGQIVEHDGWLRITVYRPKLSKRRSEGTGEVLQQAVDYVGGQGGLVGRTFPIRSGIIGAVYRLGDPLVLNHDHGSQEDLVREMVARYAFTWGEAKARVADRGCWMAAPIYDSAEGPVCGVIYLDCRKAGVFDATIQAMVLRAAEGLGALIAERYGR